MGKRIEQMVETIGQNHATQFRGEVPVTVHCKNVANIAIYSLNSTKAIDDESLLEDITIAALGHDLLEDTDIKRDDLRNQYGDRVLDYIELLTNHQDDQHTTEYMQQLASAPEEVRIIKYGDLIDNTASVIYNLHNLGLDWGNNFFRPIMDNTLKMLIDSEFSKYKEASKLLSSSALMFANLLRNKLDNKESSAKNTQ
ncbi:MAG: hypothetical protein WCP03_03285 [Candidatus Saccharibacteria bacterium]